MVRVDFVTLFPDMVLGAARHSMLRRAEEHGAVAFGAINPRTFTTDVHGTVDDKPYGGGPGMLMMGEPILAALQALEPGPHTAVVMTDPTGEPFDQKAAIELATRDHVVFVCGHYEGVDDRVRTEVCTHAYSLGDFVLTGGELPALVMADALVRLLPGVLGSQESLEADSHAGGLLSAPQYTRPETLLGEAVPEVLRSGNHEAVARWRRRQALVATRERRPDLFCRAKLTKRDLDLLQS